MILKSNVTARLSIVAALFVLGCAHAQPQATSPPQSPPTAVRVHKPIHSAQVGPRHGVVCRPLLATTGPGQYSYRLDEIGLQGVPKLRPSQIAQAKAMERKRKSKTLRFAILRDEGFIVFDAVDGPCWIGAPGYEVLNLDRGLIYYQPGQNPFTTHPVPGA